LQGEIQAGERKTARREPDGWKSAQFAPLRHKKQRRSGVAQVVHRAGGEAVGAAVEENNDVALAYFVRAVET